MSLIRRFSSAPAVCRRTLQSCVWGIILLVPLASLSANEETKTVLGKEWPATQRIAIDKIDHQAWNQLVKRYVDAKGNVDYTRWSNQAKDVSAIDDYLRNLSHADPEAKSARASRLAFWINAYNSIVVRVLLDQPPAPGLRRALPERVWTNWVLQVGDTRFSLDQIENDQLRKLEDPRIHFAIVCGAKGCPRLRDEAYTTEGLDSQLSQNGREFFADPTKFKFDPSTKRFQLSPILKWYADDFGNDSAGRLKTIAPYLPESARKAVERKAAAQVDYLDYDAEINERSTSDDPQADK